MICREKEAYHESYTARYERQWSVRATYSALYWTRQPVKLGRLLRQREIRTSERKLVSRNLRRLLAVLRSTVSYNFVNPLAQAVPN